MTDKMPLGRRDFFVGEKELLDLTVKELREELGKRRLDKRGRKLVLQDRLYDALADEEWSEMTREYEIERHMMQSSSSSDEDQAEDPAVQREEEPQSDRALEQPGRSTPPTSSTLPADGRANPARTAAGKDKSVTLPPTEDAAARSSEEEEELPPAKKRDKPVTPCTNTASSSSVQQGSAQPLLLPPSTCTSPTLVGHPPDDALPTRTRKQERPPAMRVPIAIAHHSHRTTAGEVVILGRGETRQLGGALAGQPVVEVACGGTHTVALTAAGKVFTWCYSHEQEPGEVVKGGLEGVRVVQVCAGDSHTAALSSTGEVYCWGVFMDSNGPIGLVDRELPSPTPVLVYSSPTNPAIKIASGSNHVVLLTDLGDVLTFGCGERGQLGRVPQWFDNHNKRRVQFPLTNERIQFFLKPRFVRFRTLRGQPFPKFINIFCGCYHTFAVTTDKAVYAWGLNNFGQLGTSEIEFSSRPDPVRLPPDWLTRENDQPDCSEPDGHNIEIAGGHHHSIACINGRVFAMGRKDCGRLGLGEDCEAPAGPVQVPGIEGVKTVAGGRTCSFAITGTGEGYAWGMGTSLQLGTRSEDDLHVWTPKKVSVGGRRIMQASAGKRHAALLVTHNC